MLCSHTHLHVAHILAAGCSLPVPGLWPSPHGPPTTPKTLQDTACGLCGRRGRYGGDPSCLPGSDLQSSHCTLDEACEDLDWEAEKGLEAAACSTEGFLPPKVMVRPLGCC